MRLSNTVIQVLHFFIEEQGHCCISRQPPEKGHKKEDMKEQCQLIWPQ